MSEKGKSIWLRFFRDAGILSGFDTKYTLLFDENRIKMNMLMDITKECLKDMGITAMGDIIAILRHAKHVYEESKTQVYEEVLGPTSTSNTVSSTATINRISRSPSSGSSSSSTSSPISRPKSVIIKIPNVSKFATERVVEKKTIRTLQVNTPPDPISFKHGSTNKSTTGRLDCNSIIDGNKIESSKSSTVVRLKRNKSPDQRLEVPLQKKIRVLPEKEEQYKINMSQEKTTTKGKQDRLRPSPTVPSTTKREIKTNDFARLGSEGRVSSSSEAKSPPHSRESIDEGSFKSKAFVTERLSKSSPADSPASTSSKLSTSNSDFGLNTRFVVQQGTSKNNSSFKKSSESIINREKTLATIPSSIGKNLDRNRISSPERPRSSSNNISNSQRLSMDGGNNESMKARFGIRGSHNCSRSRSPSPAIKRRLINSVSSRNRIDGNFRNSPGNRNEDYRNRIQSHGNRNQSHGNRNQSHGNRNQAHGNRNQGYENRNQAHRNRNPSHGNRNQVYNQHAQDKEYLLSYQRALEQKHQQKHQPEQKQIQQGEQAKDEPRNDSQESCPNVNMKSGCKES